LSITVSPCASLEELGEAIGPVWHYFGGAVTPEDLERWKHLVEIPRMIAAREGGAIVGGAGAFSFEMTVPGGTARAAGTTVVGVLPTHRRRGVLRSMMRLHLDDVHARGEPLAYLWASEETIYGRFGYGMAALACDMELSKAAAAFASPFEPRSQCRLVSEADAREPFAAVYERVRLETPGMFARSEAWWTQRRLADPPARRQGGGVLNRMLLTLDDKPEGYALYRIHQNLEGGITSGHVNVIEAVGTTPEAVRELWRTLLSIDWVARVKAPLLPVDHPLLFLLARPRHMKLRVSDSLWVRLVDVAAALGARRYQPGEPVTLGLRDAFCPWNEGCYHLTPDSVTKDAGDADLVLDVDALGSVYLGGFSFAQLLRAGRVEERVAGAAARADTLFRCTRAPWCAEIF
jgi:predicted acetyltransferase